MILSIQQRRDPRTFFVFQKIFIRCILADIEFYEEELQNDDRIVNNLIPQSQGVIQVGNRLTSRYFQ